MVHCGSAFEPGASGLPYYCASICVRSYCNWRANGVDSKPKKKGKRCLSRLTNTSTSEQHSCVRWSIVFRVLFQQTNKETNKKMCPRSSAGVPSSQALPGFLITAPPSVRSCCSWRANCVDSKPKKKKFSSYKIGKDKIGKGGARRAQAQGSTPGRPTLRRASEGTTLHPPRLSLSCVRRETALGDILGLPAPEIPKHSKITFSTPPRRRGVAALGRAAG